MQIDLTEDSWLGLDQIKSQSFEAIYTINLCHITPWNITRNFLRESSRLLEAGKLVFIYGAFNINGRHTSESNRVFDEHLRLHNPEWGIRDVIEIKREAELQGLFIIDMVPMPSNNLMLVLQKNA